MSDVEVVRSRAASGYRWVWRCRTCVHAADVFRQQPGTRAISGMTPFWWQAKAKAIWHGWADRHRAG